MTKLYFASPNFFWLLLLLIPLFWRYKRKKSAVQFSSLTAFQSLKPSYKTYLQHLGFFFRISLLSLLVLALARPQAGPSSYKKKTEGLDIMLVLDTSESMKALDFTVSGKRVNRLEMAKTVLTEFIENRPDDRLGVVVFGQHAFAYVPLTLDHEVLVRYLSEAKIAMAGPSTAIGDGLGVATNRLKEVKGKTKLIILLTDGSNTAGKIAPEAASKAAEAFGVKVYSIGIGTNEPVPIPSQFGIQHAHIPLDEKLLKNISETTGGRYFLASDTETLRQVYSTIDKLEKTKEELLVFHQREEKFALFLWPGLLLLLLEFLFRLTRFRRLP